MEEQTGEAKNGTIVDIWGVGQNIDIPVYRDTNFDDVLSIL